MLNAKGKSKFGRLVCLLFAALLVLAGWVLKQRMEGEGPQVDLSLTSPFLGAAGELAGTFSDNGSGLRSVRVSLSGNGREVLLMEKSFPLAGITRGGAVKRAPFELPLTPKEMGFSDGRAVLTISLHDWSWRGWLKGNRTDFKKEIVIDTTPPKLSVLTRSHNVNQGGAGLVIYRVSEAETESGISVDGNFFPGHGGYFSEPTIHLAFFALGHAPESGAEIFLTAKDRAGNASRSGIPHHVRGKRFKKDTIGLSDKFLNWKLPEFDVTPGKASENPLLDKFLIINNRLRKANTEKILATGTLTTGELYWKGTFLRLPRSAPRAGFADYRSYRYNGKIVDHQFHMGVDLASVAHSPVPAANSGTVVLVDTIGIYGKVVVIDHGFGLMSLYSHLDSIDVEKGQKLTRGEILGRTGITGMVGGDHLHFGMLIHNRFVNPLEWWDASWIKNNITSKVEDVRSLYP